MAIAKPRTPKSPRKSGTTSAPATSSRMGRPSAMVVINVRVRLTTRKGLSQLKRRLGLASQGAVLDQLVAAELRRPRD